MNPTIVGYRGVVYDILGEQFIEQMPVIRETYADAMRDAVGLCEVVNTTPEEYHDREVDAACDTYVVAVWSNNRVELMYGDSH